MLRDLHCSPDRDSALRLIADGAVVLAGGTDFVPMYSAGLISSEVAVDITGIPEFGKLETDEDLMSIGAAVRLADVGEIGQPDLGAIADGGSLVGSRQTRVRGTLGGNVCRASPSGDTLAGILASDATMIVGSTSGTRRIRAEDFFLGPGLTALEPGEILERIEVPIGGSAGAYTRATVRRAMDLATVGVAVQLRIEGHDVTSLRIAVSGAAPVPILVPGIDVVQVGLPDLLDLTESLHDETQACISPIDDARGSAWYRRKLIRPMLERSLERALARV